MATETQYENVVDHLNTLIELNFDRERGYLKASEDVEDADLKPLFHSLSQDSAKFATELADYVRQFQGEPATGQTLSGKLHQSWLDIKAAISGQDREAVIGSAQFGDKAAVEAYDDALDLEKVSMVPDLMQTLTRQRDAIQRGLDVITTVKGDRPEHSETTSTQTDYTGIRTGGGHVDPISGNY